MDTRPGAAVSEEIRCPSCARLLVLRSGPQITPHFAHRPRQSCRRRPGRAPVSPFRLEQLRLFDIEPLTAPVSPPGAAIRRRRRRAWLPRLLRWLGARATSG